MFWGYNVGVGALLPLLLIFVVAFAGGVRAQGFAIGEPNTLHSAITDLPPAIVQGQEDIDVLVDQSPFGEVILRVCRAFEATCAVSGSPGVLIGYNCQGNALVCWRNFMSAVSLSGIDVRVTPSIGGASYFFLSASSGSAPVRRSVVPVSPPPANRGGGSATLGGGRPATPTPQTPPAAPPR